MRKVWFASTRHSSMPFHSQRTSLASSAVNTGEGGMKVGGEMCSFVQAETGPGRRSCRLRVVGRGQCSGERVFCSAVSGKGARAVSFAVDQSRYRNVVQLCPSAHLAFRVSTGCVFRCEREFRCQSVTVRAWMSGLNQS